MKIPACVGMPRSASRMTWQIIKQLVPPEAPPDWHPQLVADWTSGQDNLWPIRGHHYLPTVPVVYTYRNPVEAFLSLQSRFMTEVGNMVPSGTTTHIVAGETITATDPRVKEEMTESRAAKDAMVGIGQQWRVWERLKADQQQGRDVLFIKYEDYYGVIGRKRLINDIAEFVGVPITPMHVQEIWEYTTIEKNIERAQNPQFYSHPDVTFSHGFMGESGMQKGHINLETKGRPGAYLENNPNFVKSVLAGMFPALEALNEMTHAMGYELTL